MAIIIIDYENRMERLVVLTPYIQAGLTLMNMPQDK